MAIRKNPARYIREQVFNIESQKAFGDLLGYEQATISRFESGTRKLNREAQDRIRAAAKKRRLVWDDAWFFEVPRAADLRPDIHDPTSTERTKSHVKAA